MESKKHVTLLLLVLVYSVVSAQSSLPNPNTLLAEADTAVSSLKSLRYSAEHYSIGVMNVREQQWVSVPFIGDVSLSRLPQDSVFGAKILVEGELVTNRMSDNRKFKFVYDGNQIYKIPFQEQVFYVNEPDQTGKMLFAESYDLAYRGFLDPAHFSNEIETDSVSYAGRGIVGNAPCHIVYTHTRTDSYTKGTWWFIGIADQLPRKILRRYSGTNGQDRMEVSRFTNLEPNFTASEELYSLTAPEDYKVSRFKGFSDDSELIPDGEISPEWTLKDPEGTPYSLNDYKGKIVILDFWATWCGPCRRQMPKLQKIHERFAENKVAVIGISTWENGDPKQFMAENNFTYQLLLNGDPVAENYNIPSLPTLYIINQKGRIIYSKAGTGSGSDEYQQIVEVIENAL